MSKRNGALNFVRSTSRSAPSLDVRTFFVGAPSTARVRSATAAYMASGRLGSEGLHLGLVRFEVGTFDQVDAVRDRRHDRIEALADRLRLPRQVDDQSATPDHRGLAGEDRGGHEL